VMLDAPSGGLQYLFELQRRPRDVHIGPRFFIH
jgi:hypothetical protein